MNTLAAIGDRARHLACAWMAILIGLYVALVLTGIAAFTVMVLLRPGDGGVANALRTLTVRVTIAVIGAIPLAIAFAILAIPLLMLRSFIVGPRPPHLQLGYAAVALYGPALLILFGEGWHPESWPFAIAYEVVALGATLIYIRLADAFDLFPAVEGPPTAPPAFASPPQQPAA
jgi:hypothetical protein